MEFSFLTCPNSIDISFIGCLFTDLSFNCLSQVLLKPIISQLVIEPPASLEENSNIPSTKEVDDLLVVCIGQMAVTAGTDLLWKPLNHEVSYKQLHLSAAIFQTLNARHLGF